MLWKRGKQAKSVKAQNRAVSTWLPDRNSAFCKAATEFFKYLLGIAPSNAAYPRSPTPDQISQLPDLSPTVISNDQSIFGIIIPEVDVPADNTKIPGCGKNSWTRHKRYFERDLAQNGVPCVALQFDQEQSCWNTIILSFSVKHWKSAKEHGTFSNYAIKPQHNKELLFLGILERWL